jgi:transposase InsO family protein
MADIDALVVAYRRTKDRRAGSRSLYYNLEIKTLFGLGVNRFERLMAEAGLTLAPLRLNVITTVSCYQSWQYNNLANGLAINDINKIVVGDITYLFVGRERYYLFCLTDVYSSRIVGIHISERIRSRDAHHALDAWIQLRGAAAIRGCIHHTDGGGQYFSRTYIRSLVACEIAISTARNCLQNGYAEQRNGLLKHHLLPTRNLSKPQLIRTELAEAIRFYNEERKQAGLGWRSPVEYENYIGRIALAERDTIEMFKFEDPWKNGFSRHQPAES